MHWDPNWAPGPTNLREADRLLPTQGHTYLLVILQIQPPSPEGKDSQGRGWPVISCSMSQLPGAQGKTTPSVSLTYRKGQGSPAAVRTYTRRR